ncbi:MAG: D-alanyl-D-alanine carboxypeptidase family protein [Chthoniobacterales bacterium]
MKMRLLLTFSLFLSSLVSLVAAPASYIIVDNQSGFILEQRNANSKMQVASLTKVAAAVVVLDAEDMKLLSLGARVPVTQAAVNAAGTSTTGLQVGDVLSIRDLIYAALLGSDNIAAATLADHVGRKLQNVTGLDSIGNFVSHMNALARNLGMRNTRFLNPTGLDNYEKALPYSTAADMARLTRYAYTSPDFPFYVAQTSRNVEIFRNGQALTVNVKNTNILLGQNDIDGVKTGTTQRSGECLILSSGQQPEVVRHDSGVVLTPRRIIVVSLKSQDRFREGLGLIQRGWGLYNRWASEGRHVQESNVL